MKVDAITLDLRPRSMFEAADLGVRMVGAHARSVWPTVWPVYALVAALAALAWPYGAVWPVLVVIWLKPWFDRSILFVLARAAFGESTRFADLLAAGRSVWWQGLFSSLTMRRLSPWRSYVQPVLQLEGQHGKQKRERMGRILGSHRGAALGMQWAFATAETAIAVGLSTLPGWLLPADENGNWLASLFMESGGWHAAVNMACYALTVLVLEPFFVGAGFAMYLNRRVELEAWDIEQEFRVAFAA